MRVLLTLCSLVVVCPSLAALAGDPPPRLIARLDLSLLALPNVSAWGGGGGVSVPADGTGAGFLDDIGAELGAELRLGRWVALDGSAAWYRPPLEVGRDKGPGTMGDSRSASVKLSMRSLGLVITPPKWRNDEVRVAMGIAAANAKVSDLPSSLGVTVEERSSGLAVDVRVDGFLSRNKRWGFGGALVFSDLDPSFTDTETGATGSLEVSGMFLRLGLRGAW